MKSFRALMSIVVMATSLTATAAPALADTWQQDHPRRAEVNGRLSNQNERIRQDVRDGRMSHARAAQLRHEDRQIRSEERAMASQNHSHITRTEQRALNQQENHVSRQIARSGR
jgi:hypothetical protein